MVGQIKAINGIFPITVLEAIKIAGTNKSIKDIMCTFESYDGFVKSINHRGWNSEAPENSLAAFKLSKLHSFEYVETDIVFTSDGVPMLSHNWDLSECGTILNGTKTDIRAMTYEEVKNNVILNKKFSSSDEKVPSLEEFIRLCKMLKLHPYLEIKSATGSDITLEKLQTCINIVKKYNMLNNVTWICFYDNVLSLIASIDNNARLGYLTLIGKTTDEIINDINTILPELKTKTNNEVFLDIRGVYLNDTIVSLCKEKNINIEVWTLDTKESILALDFYVSGVTSNIMHYSKILFEEAIK